MPSARDVVLGAADGYGWEQLRPFVESLRATGYDGEVTLFGRLSAATHERLARERVDVVPVRRLQFTVRGKVWHAYNSRTTRLRWHAQPLHRHVVRAVTLNRPRPRDRLTAALSNIDVARYFWYRDYLRAARHRYRNVMLTDVRDVVFLGDPFGFDVGGTANFFLEDDGRTLDSQTNNRGWIVGAYGRDAFQAIHDRPISCAGVTIGTADSVLAYLEATTAELVLLARQFRGIDQGIHNYVVHTDRVRGRLVPNSEGPVLTVGIMDGAAAADLLRRRAAEIRVVHQYDRHPEVTKAIEERRATLPERESLAGD